MVYLLTIKVTSHVVITKSLEYAAPVTLGGMSSNDVRYIFDLVQVDFRGYNANEVAKSCFFD